MMRERLGILSPGDCMALIGIANGDSMDGNVVLTEPLQSRAPARSVIFAVGEKNDRSSLGMLLGAHRLERGVQSSTQVSAAGSDRARSEPAQGVEHGAEVFGQRTADHAATGKCDQADAVGGIGCQGVHQAFGGFGRERQAVGHGVFGSHAPADVDRNHDVVTRR